jgi:1-acyl-sn-glycerol-3-phosphate acyltransferase
MALIRSVLFFLWMAVTVIPWATAVLVMSIFVRGEVFYWACVGWLRVAVWGARVIAGVQAQ